MHTRTQCRRHALWVTCHFCRCPQAPIIKEKYELCHLATGDLLRAAVEAGTLAPHPVAGLWPGWERIGQTSLPRPLLTATGGRCNSRWPCPGPD